MAHKRQSHGDAGWAIIEANGTNPDVRCVSPTQRGTQCKRIALPGSIVCDRHGGYLPNVQKRAKERYIDLADKARAVVEGILDNPNSSDGAKLKAAEMVNRATGMEQAKEVVVNIETDPVMVLLGKIMEEPDGLVAPPPAPEIVEGKVDYRQDAVDRLEESWMPDAEVKELHPAVVGTVGPYAFRGKSKFDAASDKDSARDDARLPQRVRETMDSA